MSNYTIAIAWNGKDALSDSDTAKVISGDDFHTEFSAVQTAVNSKADLNGSATESFSATTASAGTNTTQVATTAFVTSVAVVAYPIGAIFTSTVAYTDSDAVVAAIGGTTWTAFGAGKVLIGVDSSDTDFDTVEETGGSKTHTLTTSEMPAHTHSYNNHPAATSAGGGGNSHASSSPSSGQTSGSTGGGSAHNNVQPYITVYMWKRTA